jgi:hypothetical protein
LIDSARLRLASAWRPRAKRHPDFPLVAERIDDPAETPPVLVADGRGFTRAGSDRSLDDRLGVVDDEQCAAGRAVDRARAEAFHRRGARRHPERRVGDGKLGDDVISLANAVRDPPSEA